MNSSDTDHILAQIAAQQLSPAQGLQQLKQAQAHPQNTHREWLCHRVWQPCAPSEPVPITAAGVLLLITTDHTQREAWQTHFPAWQVIVASTQPQPEADDLWAVQDSFASYQRLIAALRAQDHFPSLIVHDCSRAAFDPQQLEQQLAASFYSVFYLSKALFAQKLTQPVRLLYVHQQPAHGIQPIYAGIGALAKTLTQENPKLVCQTLAVATANEVIAAVKNELQQSTQEPEVWFQSGQRFSKILQPLPTTPAQPVPLKQRGVYLITGGAGGLGLLFAQYLAYRYQARLMLTGRSPLTEQQQARLRLLEKLGAEVLYYQADVAQQAEVQNLINTARQHFGSLQGIIHSAGVLKDALVSNKKPEEAAAVLAAKVYGSVWLELATQDQPLDFLLLFSSLAGVIGNSGQCDYAFANGFLDHFALWRQRNTYAINWPFWQSGGMQMNAQAEQWLQKTKGLAAMPTAVGVQAFEAILQQAEPVVAVFYGDRPTMQRVFQIQAESSAATPPATPAPAQTPNTATHTDLQTEVEQALLALVSDLLKVPADAIDFDTDFGEYGVDSIMMMNMLNRLEALYDHTLSPNAVVDYPTIHEMASYLIAENIAVAKTVSKQPPPTAPAPSATAPQIKVALPSSKASNRFMTAPPSQLANDRNIAVIGMACRLPGAATPEAFWNNLLAGKHLVTEVPAQRWSIAEHYSPVKPTPDKSYSKWAGYIDEVELFDAQYFGISELDALTMDPQQRLLLTLTQALLDNSGYPKADLRQQRVAVFIGGSENYFIKKHLHHVPPGARNMVVNTIQNMLAARISDFYDFNAPALTLDTACSSSLVAVHQAMQTLLSGEADYAIAGGVELLLDPFPHIAFSQAEVLSDEDKCYVFDTRAKGLVLGEGAGLVMLKPYAQAVAAGDQIIGVIDGSAVNNDGHTMGVTVPNLEGQKAVIRQALAASQIDPASIGYVEAHGTGTLLGDPIEIKALTEVYRAYTQNQQYCALGSVKSNIGHLGHAAGIASLIKVLLMLQNRVMVPTLHCENPHPRFQFAQSPFYPITQTRDWTAYNGNPLIAAISSFGFGGTNCHLLLEAFRPPIAYQQQRHALPPTVLNPKRYWLTDERSPLSTTQPSHAREAHTAQDVQLSILNQLSQGVLTPEQAIKLRQAVVMRE